MVPKTGQRESEVELEISANVAIRKWAADPGSIRYAGGSENRVYAFTSKGSRYFLRLTSLCHRDKNQILAELDYVAYLHTHEFPVANPIQSINGRLVEELAASQETIFASVFSEAHGEPYVFDAASAPVHFKERGKLLGRMHLLSSKYKPEHLRKRMNWDEDSRVAQFHHYVPSIEATVHKAFDHCIAWMKTLTRTPQTFGLIHGDLGSTNFFCSDDGLIVFDFDDSWYHWFAYDLAIAIYPHGFRPIARSLLDALIEGYRAASGFEMDRSTILKFCDWRMLYMFVSRAKTWGFANITKEQSLWYQRTRENIAIGYQIS